MDNPFQHVLRLHVSLHLHCVPSPVLKKLFNASSCDAKKTKTQQNATYSINPCIRVPFCIHPWQMAPYSPGHGLRVSVRVCLCVTAEFNSLQFSLVDAFNDQSF